jgi:hypothetical protein
MNAVWYMMGGLAIFMLALGLYAASKLEKK